MSETICVNELEQWPIHKPQMYSKNARTHSESQIKQIAHSIETFGFVNPILVGDDAVIVAGHGRLLAAQQLGLETVPVICLGHLNETQRRALVIADNKLAENAGWNDELLALELGDLHELGFDLDVMGFSQEELDALSVFDDDDSDYNEDVVPEPLETVITQTGDVWVLGEHKVLCGDATSAHDIEQLLGDELVDMTFTDPPYNIDYKGGIQDVMRGHHRKILNDNLGKDFYDFLLSALTNVLSVTKGSCYVAMSSSEIDTLQKAFRDAGGKFSTFIIWAKNQFTLGRSDYQRQFEPILYGWKEGNDRFWCGDRTQSDVWFCDKPLKNDLHPTMKPIVLVERAIQNSSKTRDIVLDVFGGSGSTLIACENLNRRARLLELDPKYVDVIIRRWQDYTGKEAIRMSDQSTLNDLMSNETPVVNT